MFKRKVLWIVDLTANEASFKAHIKRAGINTVCIRTTTSRLPDAIKEYQDLGQTVWAWRWPGVYDDAAKAKGPHYYAALEADFVAAKCIPAGLDGYIVDPESDDDCGINDWNQIEVRGVKLADLATNFWKVIKSAAAARPFHCGVTSGWDFPAPGQKTILPWTQFIGPADAVYPQTYWRIATKAGQTERFNGDPKVGVKDCIPIWKTVAQGKAIIPMAGEIDLVTVEEIAGYGAALRAENIGDAHFYADTPDVDGDVLDAIKAL